MMMRVKGVGDARFRMLVYQLATLKLAVASNEFYNSFEATFFAPTHFSKRRTNNGKTS